jgi:hypothetical protein
VARRRRPQNDLQLELADWGPRECQSKLHRGRREVPVDQFVRNGKYLRTVCKLCWAESQRGRRLDTMGQPNDRQAFIDLHRAWRPPCDHRDRRRPLRNRRAEPGASKV